MNVGEAGILEQTLKQRSRAWFLPPRSEGLDELKIEDSTGMFISERVVRGFPVQIEINQFGVAARFGVSMQLTGERAEFYGSRRRCPTA